MWRWGEKSSDYIRFVTKGVAGEKGGSQVQPLQVMGAGEGKNVETDGGGGPSRDNDRWLSRSSLPGRELGIDAVVKAFRVLVTGVNRLGLCGGGDCNLFCLGLKQAGLNLWLWFHWMGTVPAWA